MVDAFQTELLPVAAQLTARLVSWILAFTSSFSFCFISGAAILAGFLIAFLSYFWGTFLEGVFPLPFSGVSPVIFPSSILFHFACITCDWAFHSLSRARSWRTANFFFEHNVYSANRTCVLRGTRSRRKIQTEPMWSSRIWLQMHLTMTRRLLRWVLQRRSLP
jgi:hypothetical protein